MRRFRGHLKIRVSVVQFHPWPPFKSIFQIKKLNQGAWALSPIFALVSNILVRCSLDLFGPRNMAATVVLRPEAATYFGHVDFRKADIEPPGRALFNEVRTTRVNLKK